MKLLVQADDYGFTKGVTMGILDAIDNGIVRNTGMFTNMPWAEWAAQYIKDRPEACFGVDFNIVSGPSVSDPKAIPHLVDEYGEFIRSAIRRNDPRNQTEEGRREMLPYEECYKEMKAQLDRFVKLTGQNPGYLHCHSLTNENYMEAIRQISKETGIPFSLDYIDKYNFKNVMAKYDIYPFDTEGQLSIEPIKHFKKSFEELGNVECALFSSHVGFVDMELFKQSSFTIVRAKDHEVLTSEYVKNWVKENDIDLITYRYLPE